MKHCVFWSTTCIYLILLLKTALCMPTGYENLLYRYYPQFFQPNYFEGIPVEQSSPLIQSATIVKEYTYYPVQGQVLLSGDGEVRGYVNFLESYQGPIKIEGTVTGLKPGLHGFHIHEKGSIADGCADAGGHYNPTNDKHAAPSDVNRHIGDLGNIMADESGTAEISIIDDRVTLLGRQSVIGRAVVVHSGQDDLGQGGDKGSTTTGNAGGRLACGVIGIADKLRPRSQ